MCFQGDFSPASEILWSETLVIFFCFVNTESVPVRRLLGVCFLVNNFFCDSFFGFLAHLVP